MSHAALRAWVDGRNLYVEMRDHRILRVPADHFAFLRHASEEQLKRIRVRQNGAALSWESIGAEVPITRLAANGTY